MTHRIAVRAAEVQDVDAIELLLAPYAEKHVVLWRSKDDLFQHLQEFIVAVYDGVVMGVAALHIYTLNMAEVRSLVVNPEYQGRQVGRLLVEACELLAVQRGIAQLFALTYVAQFFIAMDYHVVPKESLPHKIWTVCVHCKKFGACDEIAVVKRLSDEPIAPMELTTILSIEKA